ncbi:hypothetical protein HBA54_12065 [Pelagibius litoralis]|uniref:Uncharacterized protein n=1 Tax=Pelagibius litoralis TaxID=374515 RepID=A0A967K6M0_9PROT|nr:hypothetical protein [Pelagibius litoralis]NIA69328.1 hypothetical protein [Pelagibius litoralis]
MARPVRTEPAQGHNHPPDHEHLHSHPHEGPKGASPSRQRDDDSLLADALMDGFDAAEDKASFLRMARIPQHLHGADGSTLRLVDVELRYAYQVATASPAFSAEELVYLPFPANMIRERADMVFAYVSLRERRDVGLEEMVKIINDRE